MVAAGPRGRTVFRIDGVCKVSEENRPIEAGQAGVNAAAQDRMEEANNRQALIDAHIKRQLKTVWRVVLISAVLLIYTVWFMLHQ